MTKRTKKKWKKVLNQTMRGMSEEEYARQKQQEAFMKALHDKKKNAFNRILNRVVDWDILGDEDQESTTSKETTPEETEEKAEKFKKLYGN
jgi:succinate dehydrogenase flavin-adding protein (antitoxin of CptAB toxin-antitoxin module)